MGKERKLIYESDESLIYLEEPGQEKVIIKILRSNTPDPDQILRFNNEYELTKELQIKGVRKAINKNKYEQHYALTLEYIAGTTLEEAFVGKQRPIEEILEALIKIADALGRVHGKGIIHKDINGRNILWAEKDNKPVIIDFGISDRADLFANNLGNPDKIKATLSHISPEQTGRVNRKVDSRSDLYSLGITMFQLFTGKLPFEGKDSLELVHAHIAKTAPAAFQENPAIPEVLSSIIAKLMAKNAEDRYQTAFGLKHDLQKCLTPLQKGDKIHDFALGEKDFSGKFQIPQKLYGRQEEVKVLLKAFDRVSKGSMELLLVAGYSGVGKSALIAEVYKPITERRGYFVGGKFDQYQRNVPYYAVVQAFTEFCDLLLTENKESLERWRKKIRESVGENGQVLLDFIPALEKIIGPQPAVAKLEAQEALNRFILVFRNFIRAISKPEHPFVLFIDDLQWADVGSLNLIKLLATDMQNPYLLIIGAYRDNEVAVGHPLLQMMDDAVKEKAVMNTITLKPLEEEHLSLMIRDALQMDDTRVHALTKLVYSKTLGNAFFTIEFLKSLNQFGLVKYNFDRHQWDVDLPAIRKRDITNNVVDLLVSKIKELPPATRNVLKLSSCIGGLFNLHILSIIYGKDHRKTLGDLWRAVEEGLIIPLGDQYKYIDIIQDDKNFKVAFEFLHDRVQQAAYSLMDEKDREKTHLQIGRLLLQHQSEEGSLFDIVNQYNEGISLIHEKDEMLALARLNLKAAMQARDSSAYQSAHTYVTTAQHLVKKDIWDRDYAFALNLFKTAADVAYLNGDFNASEEFINMCLAQTTSPADKSEVYFMLMQNQSNNTRYADAIRSARQGLKLLDFVLPENDACAALIPDEMTKVLGYFQKNGVASIFEKPDMQDQRMLSVIRILDNLSPPAYTSGETNLWILHVLYKVNLTIAHGVTPQGGYAFSELGLIFFIQHNYEYAYPAALLSMRIVEKFRKQSPRHLSRAGHLFTNYNTPWVKHISETFKLNPEYYQVSLDSGEMIFAGYTSFHPFFSAYILGKEPLGRLLNRMHGALAFTKKIKHDLAHDSLRGLQLVGSNLAGKTASADSYDIPEMTEADFLAYCRQVEDAYALTTYHVIKAQGYYLKGDFDAAMACIMTASATVGFIIGNPVTYPAYTAIYCLTLLALVEKANKSQAKKYWEQITSFHQQFKIWAEHNPANYEHQCLLIEAETERIKGNTLQAIASYQKAITSASEYDYERETGLIHLKAGEFWLAQQYPLYAKPHLEKARYIFEKLDYKRLVEILDVRYVHLFSSSSATTTITSNLTTTTPLMGLDLQTVIRASQALSEEIILDKLLEKMLRITIENVGGQRAVLLLHQLGEWKVVADLNIEHNTTPVLEAIRLEEAQNIPRNIINYVLRTHTNVISTAEDTKKLFERDDYLKTQKPASYLCVPLSYKGETNGILYIEHRSSTNAFNFERFSVLRMLTSQMAVSLENASLYNRQSELNKAYQRFVPHAFIKTLGHESILQVKLGDHIDLDMTVMFCDIRAYASLAENMTTQENFEFINAYLMRVGSVISKHNGFINHYFGDGLIALFKESVEDALNAAIQINEEVDQFNANRAEKGHTPIAIGIGIHTGHVMMGIIGDDQRQDANVISDAVNTSSRLEGLTKFFGSRIILSYETLQHVKRLDQFHFRYLGRIKVKGKEDVLAVYEMFNADEIDVKEKKKRTLKAFNQGLNDYFEKRFAESTLSFRKVLDHNPQDKTAKLYLHHAARYIVEGVPPDWAGVELMTEK